MKIRNAAVDDLPAMLEVENKCFGRERFDLRMLEDILSDEDDETFIIEEDGAVIGSAMIQHKAALGRSRIISLAVMPEGRGKGHGRVSLDFLEGRARARGSSVMELEVRVTNVPAIDLYISNGYQILGTIPNYFGRGEDALYMEKVL